MICKDYKESKCGIQNPDGNKGPSNTNEDTPNKGKSSIDKPTNLLQPDDANKETNDES